MAYLTKTQHFFHTSLFFFLFLNSFIDHSFCQQNIETFYPSSLPPVPAPAPAIPPSSTPAVISSPPTQPTPLLPPPPDAAWFPPSQSSSHKAIYTAVGVTAASTLVVAALLFFFCTKYTQRKKKNSGEVQTVGAIAAASAGGGGGGGGAGRMQPLPQTEFTRFDGNIKGLIVDEDGLDVLYWRKLEGSQRKSGPFHKDVFSKGSNGRRTYSRGKSSSSYNQIYPKEEQQSARLLGPPNKELQNETTFQAVGRSEEAGKVAVAVPPLPPLPTSKSSKAEPTPPPPPPPMAAKNGPAPPPPPPPMAAKKGPAPPPPPLKMGGSLKPPAPPKRTPSGNIREASAIGEEGSGNKNDQVKLKPLHWEKVNVNTDHSMVWDKIERGSFQYNGDMMEALFGCVATNRKSPKGDAAAQGIASPNAAAKIFILDARRSQNIAIVIRSLGITRNELIEGLQEGKGLNVEILEKLTRMTPTREEKIQILAFEGDAGRLADAESFLYHLLKAVPSAFTRVSTMLFRFNYGSEIHQLKESLQTLDAACTELRNRGVFLKLLEAILKAGNRLNAGTTRGDAKAFNLTALRKLSDYKSSDGKTTLLHFVVHEVVRNEGRRCVMNRNNNLSRTNSQKSSSNTNPKLDESKSKEEQEKEFLQLGLPVVGGLSSEFSNVKKAATLDYDTISSISTSVGARIAETRQLVLQCGADNEGRDFIAEMKEFLAAAEGEIKVVQDEQTRVMEFVTKTAQYYQAGGFKDKQPLLIFVIVKDFLNTVDQACIDIARSLQHKKSHTSSASTSSSSTPSSPPSPDILRTRVTFPRLPRHFLSDKSSGSDTDDNS